LWRRECDGDIRIDDRQPRILVIAGVLLVAWPQAALIEDAAGIDLFDQFEVVAVVSAAEPARRSLALTPRQ
jgi:hypothetical protein